jgi:hypothetical protein
VVSGFNGMLAVSFSEVEASLFEKMAGLFRVAMGQLLESLDEVIFEGRDRERYKVKEIDGNVVDTLFGAVEYRRRVYIDVKTGERVYGLDEAMGMEKRARISPGLKEVAVLQAVEGPSYRGARDSLKTFYRHQVLSHESIRQCVLEVGKEIEREAKRERDNPQGARKVDCLFIEADGVWVSRQYAGKKETRLVMGHEGWRPRPGGTGEYELVNETHCCIDEPGGDLWEEASREFYSIYDLAETMVVINGDRAKWIRSGVKYFPKAIYQFDPFHLKRELRECLREVPGVYKDVLEALKENRSYEALGILRGVRLHDSNARRKLADLIRDLERDPEAMIDYRVRLKALGYDTSGMRGMGAAESNVNRYSRRLKKQGRSWCDAGLRAMMYAMSKRFEGTLTRFMARLGSSERVEEMLGEERLTAGAGQIVREIVTDASLAVSAHMPALDEGRNRSKGLSRFLHRLNNALPASIA